MTTVVSFRDVNDGLVHLIYARDIGPYLFALFERHGDYYTLCEETITGLAQRHTVAPTCLGCATTHFDLVWHDIVRGLDDLEAMRADGA